MYGAFFFFSRTEDSRLSLVRAWAKQALSPLLWRAQKPPSGLSSLGVASPAGTDCLVSDLGRSRPPRACVRACVPRSSQRTKRRRWRRCCKTGLPGRSGVVPREEACWASPPDSGTGSGRADVRISNLGTWDLGNVIWLLCCTTADVCVEVIITS